MASRAFTHRFIRTWWTWFGSTKAGSRSSAIEQGHIDPASIVWEKRAATSRTTFPSVDGPGLRRGAPGEIEELAHELDRAVPRP